MEKSIFETLFEVNVNDHVEKKNGLSYLSWPYAWAEVKKRFPDANYKVYETETGCIYFTDGRTCWVKTGVEIAGLEHIEYLPIMDYKNKSINLENVTSFDVNKTIQRSLTKALQFAQAQLEGIRKQNKCLENTIAIQTQQISEMMPKASYYDVVLNCKDLVSMSVIAKDYGWSASRMNKYLHEKGVQFRQGDIWLLYQKYAEKGYTSTKTHTYLDNSGQHTKVHTYWSQKGRLFIYDLLKKDGILPQVERGGEIL